MLDDNEIQVFNVRQRQISEAVQVEGIEQSYVAKATEVLQKIRNIGGSKQSSKYRPKGQSYKQSQNVQITKDSHGSNQNRNSTNDTSILLTYRRFDNEDCYIAGAKTKRDWLIHGHVALDKCSVSLGQKVNNCCPLRPAAYINKHAKWRRNLQVYKLGFSSILFEEIHNKQRGYASETKI